MTIENIISSKNARQKSKLNYSWIHAKIHAFIFSTYFKQIMHFFTTDLENGPHADLHVHLHRDLQILDYHEKVVDDHDHQNLYYHQNCSKVVVVLRDLYPALLETFR